MIELVLQQAIVALSLLLLAQLGAVLAHLLTALAMLAGSVATTGDGALISIASVTLQEELIALTTADAANCISISSHFALPPIRLFFSWGDGSHCEEWE